MYAWEAWTEEFVETFTAALVDHDMEDGGGRHGCGMRLNTDKASIDGVE